MQRISRERERERESNYKGSFHKLEVVLSPLHFQGEFTKIKRLRTTQQEISYAQEQNQETSYAQA